MWCLIGDRSVRGRQFTVAVLLLCGLASAAQAQDTVPPVITVPDDITVETDPGVTHAVVFYDAPTASDNVGVVSLTLIGLPSGSEFPVGENVVGLTATDAAGNSGSGTFTITVLPDTEPPVVTVPDDITVGTDPGVDYAVVTYDQPTTSDNNAVVSAQFTGLPSGSQFPVGTTGLSVTASDAAGNTTTEFFSITVVDDEAPAITAPANITVGTDFGLATAVVSFAATVNDNVDGPITPVFKIGGTEIVSPHTFSVGTTTVTIDAADSAGNAAQASFTVTVLDTESPKIVNFPEDITVDTDPGLATAVVSWTEPDVSDNVGIDTLTKSHAPGDTFPLGTTTVTYTATDFAGTVNSQSFDVTVEDNEPPSFTSFPDNIDVGVDYPATTATVSWTEPVASDNATPTTVEQTEGSPSGSEFPLGATTISYVARDEDGNETTQSFVVSVSQVPPGTVTFVINAGVDGTFGFSSTEPALTTSVVAVGGAAVVGPILLPPGSYPISFTVPTDIGVSAASCSGGASTLDATTQSGTIVLVSEGDVTCTITTFDSVATTAGQIGAFLEARGQQILQAGRSFERRRRRLDGNPIGNGGVSGPGGLAYRDSRIPFALAIDKDAASFSYSLLQARSNGSAAAAHGNRPVDVQDDAGAGASAALAFAQDGQAAFDPADGLAMQRLYEPPDTAADIVGDRMDIWVEVHYAKYAVASGDGDFAVVHVGADYLVTRDVLVGVSGQVDWTDLSSTDGGYTEGIGFLVGPYLTARLRKRLLVDARLAWGRSYNEISPFDTYTDDFDATRWLATLALIGDFNLSGVTILPELRISYFTEKSGSYVDGLGVTIPSVESSTGLLEFGTAVRKSLDVDTDMRVTPFAKAEGIWTFAQDNSAAAVADETELAGEGLRARFEAGFDLDNAAGGRFSLSGFYDGVGDDDFEAWGLTIGLRQTF